MSSINNLCVIKLGGAALKDSLEKADLFKVFSTAKVPLVIVHGGGPLINQLSTALNLKVNFVDGQRVTDAPMMDAVEMALSGQMNSAIVRGLRKVGSNAIGFSAAQLGILKCSEENPALGLVGKPQSVDTSLLKTFLHNSLLCVIAPVGTFENHEACNVNADLAASAIAKALGAKKLIFLTDRDGILDSEGSPIKNLSKEELQALSISPTIQGGMKVKARAILEFINSQTNSSAAVINGSDLSALSQMLSGVNQVSGTSIQ